MKLRRANRLKKNAELAHAQKSDPEAHTAAKALGVKVGKRVRYTNESGFDRFGVVRELSRIRIESKYVDSAVIELNAAGLFKNGENIVVRADEIALAKIQEVLGDGQLAHPDPKPVKPLPPPPPRASGYEFCDMGNCEEPPAFAVVIRKFDPEINDLGPRQIVALCKGHYSPYREQTDDKGNVVPIIPEHWRMGVAWEVYVVPKPGVNDADSSIIANEDDDARDETDSPYEGKRGRHPTDCTCSRHGGK